MKKLILILLGFCILQESLAQHVMGKVFTLTEKGKKEALPGVNIYFIGTTVGTTTDESGMFHINAPENPQGLVFSYVGFNNDTVLPANFSQKMEVILISAVSLNEFEISYRKKTSEVSLINPLNITSVGEQELRKAACCNLSE